MPVEAYVRLQLTGTGDPVDVVADIKARWMDGTLPRIGVQKVDYQALNTTPRPFGIIVGFCGKSRAALQTQIDVLNGMNGIDGTRTRVVWNDSAPN